MSRPAAGTTARSLRGVAWVSMLAAAAVAVLVAELHRQPRLAGPLPWLTLVLAVGLVGAELRPPRWLVFRDAEVSLSWVAAYGLVLIDAAALAMILLAATNALADARRAAVTAAIFNASQLVLSLAAGAAVLHAGGGADALVTPGATLGPAWVAGVLAGGVATYAVNAGLVAGHLAIRDRVRPSGVFVEGLRANLSGDGILIALSPVIVVVGQRSLWLLPFVALAALGVTVVGRMAVASRHAAVHDPLTGLLNRRGFEDAAGRFGQGAELGLTVAVIDLDGFKPVNDTFGHAAGDAVLVETAARLRDAAPRGAVVARLGGDEFAVAWRSRDEAEARRSGEHLLRAFMSPVAFEGRPVRVGASIGISVGSATLDLALEYADVAMYRAKTSRSGVAVTDGRRPVAHGLLDAATLVTAALDTESVAARFRPVVDTASGAVAGLEAVAGGGNGADGWRPLPDIDDGALRARLTWASLEQACELLRVLGPGHPAWVAVGVGRNDLADVGFPDRVGRLLGEERTAAGRLRLAVDAAAIDGTVEVRSTLDGLDRLGVGLVVTGLDPAGSLRPLAAPSVRAIAVGPFDDDPEHSRLVRAAVATARHLGIELTADRVASLDDWAGAVELGCALASGPMIGEPLAPAEVPGWRLQVVHLPADARPDAADHTGELR